MRHPLRTSPWKLPQQGVVITLMVMVKTGCWNACCRFAVNLDSEDDPAKSGRNESGEETTSFMQRTKGKNPGKGDRDRGRSGGRRTRHRSKSRTRSVRRERRGAGAGTLRKLHKEPRRCKTCKTTPSRSSLTLPRGRCCSQHRARAYTCSPALATGKRE